MTTAPDCIRSGIIDLFKKYSSKKSPYVEVYRPFLWQQLANGKKDYYSITTNVTRRFIARLLRLLLSTTGLDSP